MKVVYDAIRNAPMDALTREQIRLRIGRRVGLSGPYTCFGKGDLNAIHAYLTGEHHFPKRLYGTEHSPPTRDVRAAIAEEVGIESFPTLTANRSDREFRKNELIEIAERIESQEDERH